MKKDFDLIVHKFKKSITIVPVADVHLGAIEHDRKAWDAFVRYVESNEDVHVILAGDLINNSIRTSVANPFDEVLRPREQKIRMVEYLKPIKDKILCAVSGNHERRSTKEADIDLTYDIMAKLDIEDVYRENIAFMKVSCGVRGSGTPECSYSFCVTHGDGGGTSGGAINRKEAFGNIIDGMDCLITGHDHKGTVTRPSKIVIDMKNNIVTEKSYLQIGVVPWLIYGGYAARKMLRPSETSNPQKLVLSEDRNKKG